MAVVNSDLQHIYDRRCSDLEAPRREGVWREITRYLERWIEPGSTVLDVGCDRGSFINEVVAGRKIAVDVRDTAEHLDADVEFVRSDGLALLDHLPAASVDVVFMSNYLEHLRSSDDVLEQLKVAARLLRPGGRLIVLQPNIRLVGFSYWDFLDHKTALTERSLEEAAITAGLETEKLIARFLPYTTKSRVPQSPLLVRAYLRFPPAWVLMGRQSLLVARRPG
jgi:ubiquinone/menaquinone biosynthesis C-methylase UbiE